MDQIKIYGARTNNLKNINLVIPRYKLIIVTGLSGSGKSSLAFNTLYAEGQRRYAESLSVDVRQFLSLVVRPDVDNVKGLSPTISIAQKSILHSPRSTVGTVTEINDYLRLLFARVGEPRCPEHKVSLKAQTISQMVDHVLTQPVGKRLMIISPIIKKHKGEHNRILETLVRKGYMRARIDGKIHDLLDTPKLKLQKKHTIEVIIDRFKINSDIANRLAESFEVALELSGGTAIVVDANNTKAKELFFSANCSCPICGYSMPELEPRLFSFNNPAGACVKCDGLGVQQYCDPNSIIQSPELSLANGAIKGYDKYNAYFFQKLKSLSQQYNFDIETRWACLSKKIQKLILFGSSKDKIAFNYNNYSKTSEHDLPFEGVICNIERRYKETKCNAVRNLLSKFIRSRNCIACGGTRLRQEACNVYLENTTLPNVLDMSISHAIDFFTSLKFVGQQIRIAEKIIQEIIYRLKFLMSIGLNYLTLSRSSATLSSGEAQRVYLASQIGSGLVGMIYILDEPSIGLHQRDNKRLLDMLLYLRNLGNTVIMTEHDEDAIRIADHIIDMGPGAGIHGGYVVAEGSLSTIMKVPDSLTGQYISGKRKIELPKQRMISNPRKLLKLSGACGNNLKRVTLELPIGLFTCITGVSGSGKSTLIKHTLFPLAQKQLNGSSPVEPAPYSNIQGLEYFNAVIDINQSSIGCTPRSNLATYTGIFLYIRELFANVPESRSRGYTSGRFSFNLRGGRCESCHGEGVIKVDMHFLPDIHVKCDQCNGKRYNRETLEIKYKGKNIYEVLHMTVEEAYNFFYNIPTIASKLQVLMNIGLTYIQLGQTTITLSRGESQRVKLARELARYRIGQTLYILDEPSIGLHYADIQRLLEVLQQLRNQGNTIVVIEHNMSIIKTADWIVDLGPEGGNNGGQIIVSGPPEIVAQCELSYTAHFLKSLL